MRKAGRVKQPWLRRHPMAGLFVLVVGPMLVLIMAVGPAPALAQVHAHPAADGTPVVRSLESLRDLDDQSWQVVAYREGPPGGRDSGLF